CNRSEAQPKGPSPMLRRLIVVTALAAGMSIAAITLASPALAKGPSQARFTGPCPGPRDRRLRRRQHRTAGQALGAGRANQPVHRVVRRSRQRAAPNAGPAEPPAAGGLPRPAVEEHVDAVDEWVACGRVMRTLGDEFC